MRLFNTLTKTVDEFGVIKNSVSLYVCGITPYDTTHIGHAFTYSSIDILVRYLEWQGVKVIYAQNVTDIDDDILRKAGELKEGWKELGDRWTAHFIQDMQALNIRPPDYYPRATDNIPQIIEMVKGLLNSGVAYEAGGSVYYHVADWPGFGNLCGIPAGDRLSIANERGNRPDDIHKQDPIDFVLWQAQAPEEPFWESPWGPGRPGWHIECSTMASRYLGIPVDIHAGGADLCFPHHECEIAQVEPLKDGLPFVRFWLHTSMVYYEGEKMSKSLGNLVMVSDLLNTYSPDALRLYFGGHHYRETWSYSQKDLERTKELADRITKAAHVQGGNGESLSADGAWASFTRSMDNDLDTPQAARALAGLADSILEAAMGGREVNESQAALRAMGKILGLRLGEAGSEKSVLEGWNQHLDHFRPNGNNTD